MKTDRCFYKAAIISFPSQIGWRRWRGPRQDLDTPLYTNVLNFLYPSFIFFLMVAACVTQTLTCFYRDEVRYGPVDERGILVVRCTEHILTRSVIADALLLAAYLFGVYFFRYKEPEHLSALMERVYLSFNFKHRVSPQRRLTFTLRMILSLSAVWVLLSLAGNILRLFSLSLLNNTTYFALISTIPATNATATNTTVPMNRSLMENITRYALVIYSIIGFVLFDMLYVAVVVSYASHAQLLLTYINSVIDKVQTKACDLGKAIRDMSQIYESLKVLNATLSHLTSVCLFIFITTSISSLVGLASINVDPEMGRYRNIHISVGVINFVQWTLLALAPITQASRLTSTCRRLRRLGLEIGARPFSYHDTPQLVLDSFLQYTNATRYTAKLAGVPIYPKGVIGFLFVFGIVATWALVKFNPFSFASWF
jgi:hypothetical protein